MNYFLKIWLLLCLTIPANAQSYQISPYGAALKECCALSAADLQQAAPISDYISKRSGYRQMRFQQNVNGLAVDGSDLQLNFNKSGELRHAKAVWFHTETYQVESLNNRQAPFTIAAALSKLGISVEENSESQWLSQIIAPQLVYLPNEEAKKLVLAFKYFLPMRKSSEYWVLWLQASSGDILKKVNLTLECHWQEDMPAQDRTKGMATTHYLHNHSNSCLGTIASGDETDEILSSDFAYRVFPMPVESPSHGAQQLVVNPAHPEYSLNGWQNHTINASQINNFTFGNNVRAYEDTLNLDIPGSFAYVSSQQTFDYPFNPLASPLENLNSSIVNLFYWNNILHDFAYAYGFDEISGNFQRRNFTVSSGENDEVQAEAMDGSGTNNANFATPEDGLQPRMQMYLWNSSQANDLLQITTPDTLAGFYPSVLASFGPQTLPEPLEGSIVRVVSAGVGNALACTEIVNDVAGKIALIDRGSCTFSEKVWRAEQAGAIAVIIANNTAGPPISMGGGVFAVNIPSIMISRDNGNRIKAFANDSIHGIISIVQSPNRKDSSFDNGVIAHEYGHGISNRLTGGRNNVYCLFNEEQAGEGWSDFMALVTTTTAQHQGSDRRGIGTYLIDQSPQGNGIRPFPYSTDMSINPVTYNDVRTLSVPHGVGSVWCSMIWDLYWNMVDLYGFDADLLDGNGGNNKAVELVFEGMRIQNCQPGFIDSREGILLADDLLHGGMHECLIWKTFARRGLGYSALQGSADNVQDGTQAFDLPPYCVTAIDEVAAENNAKLIHLLFPNPSQGIFQLQLDSKASVSSMQLFDLKGRQLPLASPQTLHSGNNLYQLHLEHLPAGVYFLQVNAAHATATLKLVKY